MDRKEWGEFVKDLVDLSYSLERQTRKSAIIAIDEIDEINKLLAEASEQVKEEQE